MSGGTREVAFPRIGSFDPKDPESVQRALALFESRLMVHLRDRAQRSFGPFERTSRQTASCNARPWQLVRVDPSGGALNVILPAITDPTAKVSWIGVKNISASTNAITVAALGTTIDGSASFVMNTARQFQWFYAGDDEWERGPS